MQLRSGDITNVVMQQYSRWGSQYVGSCSTSPHAIPLWGAPASRPDAAPSCRLASVAPESAASEFEPPPGGEPLRPGLSKSSVPLAPPQAAKVNVRNHEAHTNLKPK